MITPLPAPFPAPVRRWATRAGLALWALGTAVLCAYLLGAHLLSLPTPATNEPRLRAAVARARGAEGKGDWIAFHLLYRGCRCSRRVLEHLLERGPAPGYAETIVLVGDADGEGDEGDRARAAARGYRVEAIAAEALGPSYGVEAAPLLVVAAPSGEVRYVGGYSERKQGPLARGAGALARLAAGERVAPLPAFGCAVSERLRTAVDPFGVRASAP
jgi:hypothetical protein